MSISYTDDITDGQGFFILVKLLRRWRGSLYKLVWVDLLIYIIAYYVLNMSYRLVMSENQKIIFEQIVVFCEKTMGDIPISFLLGFFVSGIIGRWYTMYMYIPWMNEIALKVAYTIDGRNEEETRKIRLTIMRYLNLSWILMMRTISDQIATRFAKAAEQTEQYTPLAANNDESPRPPTSPSAKTQKLKVCRNTYHPWSIDTGHAVRPASRSMLLHTSKRQSSTSSNFEPRAPLLKTVLATGEDLDDSENCPDAFQACDDNTLLEDLASFNRDEQVKRTFGVIITTAEIKAFERIALNWYRQTKERYAPEYWVPIQWAQRLAMKALQSGHIADPKSAFYLVYDIGKVRQQMQDLQIFSSIMIPLVYTQVVIIAVYSYFLCQIFACQFVESRSPKDTNRIDLYVPIFSIFSFLFLMGWLKVALCVMNPFGDDDEDFQTSQIFSYNLDVSYRTVYMEPSGFPQHLSFPLNRRPREEAQEEMNQFLDEVDIEVQKNQPIDLNTNYRNLEVNRTIMDRFRSACCCNSSPGTEPPQTGIVITNADDYSPRKPGLSTVHPSHNKWAWLDPKTMP